MASDTAAWPWEYLSAYPGLSTDVLASFRQLIHRLLDELAQVEGGLTRVVCHGDTHGFNNQCVHP